MTNDLGSITAHSIVENEQATLANTTLANADLYDATLYTMGSSLSTSVSVAITPVNIEFMQNSEVITYSLSDAQLEPILGTIPREVKLPNGSTLVFDASVPVERYFHETHSGWLNTLEKHKRYVLLALVLVPVFFVLIIKYVIPSAARSVAPLMPHSVNQRIDEQTLYIFDKTILDESELSVAVQDAVQHNWLAMIKQINDMDLPVGDEYHLLFRKSDALAANAFALPGGTVVITDALVELLTDKPEAIQAILLHEIGHVYHHHGMQMMAETLGVTLLMTYVLGDLEGVAEMFNGISATIIQNKFSQSLESEADDFSLAQLNNLGIPSEALADAFIALSKETGTDESLLEEYYTSHPSIKSRIEKAKKQ